ncbi:hypothetical protein PTTG_28478 [Puccinia triticina 1-1 BBBD Race 1]|uniref:Uncharacterized protein n=1 Tax=Puccinia triticina (isolate 1-1 / race 1 (BBBD)) TaxID=630390 RepID=A0A180GC73_PUCT1|nr:hypothetical protein PTTG_28478 [Puccinia triticina 1-1 BBBD Race 1]
MKCQHLSPQIDQNVASGANIQSQPGPERPTDKHAGAHDYSQGDQKNTLEYKFRFMDKYAVHTILQAARFHFEDYMSEEVCQQFLADEKMKVAQLGERLGFQTATILKDIPALMSTVIRRLGLDCPFQEQAACPKCWTLYKAIPDSESWAKQKLHQTVTMHCTVQFFTTTRKLAKTKEQGTTRCEEPVFKNITALGRPAWRLLG